VQSFVHGLGNDVRPNTEEILGRRGAPPGLGAHSLDRAERSFGVWLRSERLGLSGKLDLSLPTADAACPVDFKDNTTPYVASGFPDREVGAPLNLL